MPRVIFPTRRIAGARPEGETIHEAIRALGFVIDYACGGNALCGTCAVRVVEGAGSLTPMGADEAAKLAELGYRAPHRLSCQARFSGDIVVLPGV